MVCGVPPAIIPRKHSAVSHNGRCTLGARESDVDPATSNSPHSQSCTSRDLWIYHQPQYQGIRPAMDCQYGLCFRNLQRIKALIQSIGFRTASTVEDTRRGRLSLQTHPYRDVRQRTMLGPCCDWRVACFDLCSPERGILVPWAHALHLTQARDASDILKH